ncbi:MAG: TonB family protein [Burkholderiales bacterium]|nr:TonB family protein [Burkholderiales bacterium]
MSIAEAFFQTFPAPPWWRRMDTSQRILAAALIFSTAAHAGLLILKFTPPEALRLRPVENKLDVILVNARHASKPAKPDALAQANLDGGGEAAQGRAKSFLPKTARAQDGEDLRELSARVRQLEEEQKKLLTSLASTNSRIAASDARPDPQPDPAPTATQPTGLDLLASTRQILRAEAEIARRIEDENARPKRGYLTPSTREVEYALYFRQWAEKVERHGNNNYPEAAKGRNYRLTMTVSLFADGNIEKIEIDRGSGTREVDAAAVRIVRAAGPYGRFSQEMRRRYGVLDLTMTWTFARSDALSVEGSN